MKHSTSSVATVSAIPEDVLCFILSYAHTFGPADEVSDAPWPIQRIERYASPTSVSGLGRGSAMQTRYAVVLRVSFVSMGAPWDGALYRDIYFKVLPKGTAQVPGLLLGFPVLDPSPRARP